MARLIDVAVPDRPTAAVLVLHGGAARFPGQPVSRRQVAVLRMIPVARQLRRSRQLAVFRLLNSSRGWDPTLTDVRWALDRLRERLGEVPIGLVGHSLGGRAALLAGGADQVRSIVALAPWVEPTDAVDLTGRRVLIVHGTADRVARIERARTVAENLSRTADLGFITVEGGSHGMLRHHRLFDGSAADFMAATLLDQPPSTPAIREILSGRYSVDL